MFLSRSVTVCVYIYIDIHIYVRNYICIHIYMYVCILAHCTTPHAAQAADAELQRSFSTFQTHVEGPLFFGLCAGQNSGRVLGVGLKMVVQPPVMSVAGLASL